MTDFTRTRAVGSTRPGLSRPVARRIAHAAGLLLAAATLTAGGCNIVGPIAYAIEGPGTVPAQHILADVPTVVFVDDRRNVLTRTILRSTIGDTAAEVLMGKDVLSRTISSGDAVSVARRQETEKALLPMDAIGKAVGAEQVIYVNMVSFGLTTDGYNPRPTAVAEVRVIDVGRRVRAFPPDGVEGGRTVEANLREIDPDVLRTQAARRSVEDQLAAALGLQIARLFFEHERVNLGGNLR